MASNLTTCGEMKSVNPIDTNVNDKSPKLIHFGSSTQTLGSMHLQEKIFIIYKKKSVPFHTH